MVIVAASTFTPAETLYHPGFAKIQPLASFGISTAYTYPPGVGILTNAPNCLNCHNNIGSWRDDQNTIIDIFVMDTRQSLKHNDGTFLIETKMGEPETVLTVLWISPQ